MCGNDASQWALVNASPDILAQLKDNPVLQPARAPRDTAIGGIVLADAQIDHTTGLFMLRESTRPLAIWCTDNANADLTRGNPIFGVLGHYCGIERRSLPFDGTPFSVTGAVGVQWRAIAVASKPAPFSPHREKPQPGDNVALILREGPAGGTLVYAPGLGSMEEAVWREMQSAACVLVDGTFWTDEEMLDMGLSRKRAREIGHLPQSGAGGMLEWLQKLPPRTRKILIHVNNTNPILDEASAERAELTRLGIEVAHDGMEIRL